MRQLLETEILRIFIYPLLSVDTGIKLEVLKIEKASGCLRKIKSGNTYKEGFMICIPHNWKSLVSILLSLASLVAFTRSDCGP